MEKVTYLRFIRERQRVTRHELACHFRRSEKSASKKLGGLKKQGLVNWLRDMDGLYLWVLTDAGERRLDYFERRAEDAEDEEDED